MRLKVIRKKGFGRSYKRVPKYLFQSDRDAFMLMIMVSTFTDPTGKRACTGPRNQESPQSICPNPPGSILNVFWLGPTTT